MKRKPEFLRKVFVVCILKETYFESEQERERMADLDKGKARELPDHI